MKVKTSKEDFEFSNLPRNRKEVFFDVFKILEINDFVDI